MGMPEIDPNVRRIRRIGVGVFLAVAALSVPLGMHIQNTWIRPELGLTLLGAVLLLVLISLFALETAVIPIPDPIYEDGNSARLEEAHTELLESASEHEGTVLIEPQPDPAQLRDELHLDHTGRTNPDGPMLIVPSVGLASATTRLSDTEPDRDERS